MEYINKEYAKNISQLQWYIERFKKRMKNEMKEKLFNPNATKEIDWYDGVNTELNKNFTIMGIDTTDVFRWPEQTIALLKNCVYKDNIDTITKDQLYHALIGSTRRPYHVLWWKEDELCTENDISEVVDLIDSNLLSEVLLREKFKFEQVKKIEKFLWKWRNSHIKALKDNTLEQTHHILRWELENIWIKESYNFSDFEYIINNCLYDWRDMFNLICKSPDKIDHQDVLLYEDIKLDPIFSFLVGWTWWKWREKHVFNDNKLATILFNINQIKLIETLIENSKKDFWNAVDISEISTLMNDFTNKLNTYTNKKLIPLIFLNYERRERFYKIIWLNNQWCKDDIIYHILIWSTPPINSKHIVSSRNMAIAIFDAYN